MKRVLYILLGVAILLVGVGIVFDATNDLGQYPNRPKYIHHTLQAEDQKAFNIQNSLELFLGVVVGLFGIALVIATSLPRAANHPDSAPSTSLRRDPDSRLQQH